LAIRRDRRWHHAAPIAPGNPPGEETGKTRNVVSDTVACCAPCHRPHSHWARSVSTWHASHLLSVYAAPLKGTFSSATMLETIPLSSPEAARHEKASPCQLAPHKRSEDIFKISAGKSDDPDACAYQSCLKDVGNGAADQQFNSNTCHLLCPQERISILQQDIFSSQLSPVFNVDQT